MNGASTMVPTYTYLGHDVEPYVEGHHTDVRLPRTPDGDLIICPLGYAPMVWPSEKGKPPVVYFHWPTQISDVVA